MNAFLHKLFGTNPHEGVQPKEALSYSLAGLGQNLICGLVGSFISYYFTNGLLMAPVTVGLIMLFIRVFDAMNDPIMGSIVDRTRTKYGKCRPYLLWTPIPIAIVTVLLFLPLKPDTTSTIVIMTIIYLVWSVVYTIVDVPYWGLATAMTTDTNQRGTILTVARIFCTLGAGVISIIIPNVSGAWIKPFANADGAIIAGNEGLAAAALRQNYWWLAIIIVLIALPTFFIGFKNSKERFYSEEAPRSLKSNLGLLFKNKPLLLIILSGILGGAKMLYMYSGIYLAQYNLAEMGVSFLGMKGAGLFTLITMAVVPGGLIASVLVPWCTRKFGKKATFIWSHIFGGVVMFVMFLFGWKSNVGLIVNLVGLVFLGIPQGFSNIITYAMIADTVDYLEWKEGIRAEGICFAMQTFINKIGMAIGAAVACFGLGWAGIDAKDAITYSMSGNLQGLNLLYTVTILVPAISMIACAIPLFFYDFDEKTQAQAVAEIAQRKAAQAQIAPK